MRLQETELESLRPVIRCSRAFDVQPRKPALPEMNPFGLNLLERLPSRTVRSARSPNQPPTSLGKNTVSSAPGSNKRMRETCPGPVRSAAVKPAAVNSSKRCCRRAREGDSELFRC
jgi:hypothetical protein